MENASKALIIAGAILLSILIISLGIIIFNQASGVVNNNAMSDVEIQQFNQKFTQYEGERVRGATVNSMLQAVLANNVSADSSDRQITVEGDVKLAANASTLPETKASTGSTYKVSCVYGQSGGTKGLVIQINVENLSSSAGGTTTDH